MLCLYRKVTKVLLSCCDLNFTNSCVIFFFWSNGIELFCYLLNLVLVFCISICIRIRNCLTQLNAKDITPDDKQELDEALQREVSLRVQECYEALQSVMKFLCLGPGVLNGYFYTCQTM